MNLFPFFQQFPKDHDQTENVILRSNNLFSNLSKGSFFSVAFPVVHCNWSLPLVSTNSWTSSLPLVSTNSWTLSKGFKTWKTWVLKLLTLLFSKTITFFQTYQKDHSSQLLFQWFIATGRYRWFLQTVGLHRYYWFLQTVGIY